MFRKITLVFKAYVDGMSVEGPQLCDNFFELPQAIRALSLRKVFLPNRGPWLLQVVVLWALEGFETVFLNRLAVRPSKDLTY